MKIGTTGIVTNEYGHILLIRRDDTLTLAPPGGTLDSGELLTEGVAREVHEETGIKVLPVRRVGIDCWPRRDQSFLIFSFRCLIRGGQLTPSTESPQVGYFPTNPLPKPMLYLHHERVATGIKHKGGPPLWRVQKVTWSARIGRFVLFHIIYPFKNWQRRRQGKPVYQPTPNWTIEVRLIILNEAGHPLWVRQASDTWQLPGGLLSQDEPPWETAVTLAHSQTGLYITLTNLSSLYQLPDKDHLILVFTADATGQPTTNCTYYERGQEPATAQAHHREYITNKLKSGEEIVFRFHSPPSPD